MNSAAESVVDRVEAAYRRIAEVDRSEVWIHLREAEDALAEARRIDEAAAVSVGVDDAGSSAEGGGADLPLRGVLVAVKDNIDVAGMPTTAGAPSYAYQPSADAPAVARLRAAGALVIGKTNLDQFATGLVGTRSPYGAVCNAWDPSRISGGSSAGSGVAVALGIVDIALGTDTAGSGRVPAALNGIVGLKPTRGLVPTIGVVPACQTLDCVTVFARELPLARSALGVMTSPAAEIAEARFGETVVDGVVIDSAENRRRRIGVPHPEQIGALAAGWAEAFAEVVGSCRDGGIDVVEIDLDPMLEAARMLYESALVAQRHEAVGEFVEAHRDEIGEGLDPTVSAIVLNSGSWSAVDLLRAQRRLRELGVEAARRMAGVDALLTPTTTQHPTLAAVAADPVGVNADLGRFTNFANLLDMAAVAVPAGEVEGLPFGVMLTGRAGSDGLLASIGETLG
ncbi:MAG: allophanate hydrolase [Acidipropionibacterium sp.]|nr:allophanate hydrolase [Acidipropionibacterium sp.]